MRQIGLFSLVLLGGCDVQASNWNDMILNVSLASRVECVADSPWRELKLPLKGAVVDTCSHTGLLLKYPSTSPSRTQNTYVDLRDALLDAGWRMEQEAMHPEDRYRLFVSRFSSPLGRFKLKTMVKDGRPSALLVRTGR